ncbi:MAG: UDP-3-O-(3-hydroxymyristoyl)glucosamine N-acyltransferase [Gemmatimonadetes bacterium]|nr:UDP-3-O-(3-hydroxymyristoyl)glucosamine N-acyltransferase [Gemmatimonadota bacterium]
MTAFTVQQLAELVAGRVEGDASRRVDGVASVDHAGPTDVTFVVSERYAERLGMRSVGACLVDPDMKLEANGTAFIRVDSPELAFSKLLGVFHPEHKPNPGLHPTAIVGRGTRIGDGVSIGPYVTIGEDTVIGAGTQVGAHTHIDDDVVIGRDCRIGAGCTILHDTSLGDRVRIYTGVRLGVDGFGYTPGADGLTRIPQVGRCIIENDVEIGANCTVDRGALGDTVIGQGTKIDNLVHIAHNVTIGDHCIIVAQVGIAGSVNIGPGAHIGGQAGISGHLAIGRGARIAAQAGVFGDVPAGETYSGYPARPHRQALRASALTLRLPEMLRRLVHLERRLDGESE